ncbi:MBL fold metallo-hydrolase [Limisalsivibrio acetivorans]|uniref:MBL fold metallo-hydrolase n=1 Tax=Limisalsivibrio acetivorans TaxID=1304888 RepID=UPI0003B53F5F|nr:MBL fold metallo-hydrolase [Limisalsivibrio acetivorans]
MKRRTFLKGLGASAVGLGAAATLGSPSKALAARGKEDIGECKSLKITVLSETSWFNNDQFKKDIVDNGGASTNQYAIPWDRENSGGYAALLEIEQLDGTVNKLLLDTGWNNEWMDYVYERHGIDKMLKSGEIDTMVLSHWHLDHFWGIESTLKHNDKITMYGPETMYEEDEKLLYGGKHEVAGCENNVPFKGKLIKTNPKEWYKLMPGLAVKEFDVPILLRVRGENVIYVNVKDKGIVTVTGCCHPGLLTLYSTARRNIKGGEKIYGCYGGLHISLFENWDPKFDDIIKGAERFEPVKMGCNHCTGWIWAENAAKAGLPIVKGTNTYKTYPKQSSVAKESNVFLTNGDTVTF